MSNDARILVVDDEPRNVKLLSAHLSSDGFEPMGAFNGTEALQLATSENPDVILLDIMMPDMDGFEVTRRLKADSMTRHIPVVLVTSLDGSGNRVKGLDAGADEFLTKPVNRAELLVRVRALQRMKQMQDELQNRKKIVSKIVDEPHFDSKNQASILLVEDDERLCKQLSDILGAADYHTVRADSATMAKEVLTHHLPDLILLDRLLPDRDGLSLLDEWKADDQLKALPVIVITAVNDLERKIEGIEHGADDYLIKPIENNELLARVRAGLRRSSTQRRLLQDIEHLKHNTVTDRLTGVRNRQYLDADLEHRFAQSHRDLQRMFSAIMLDIDHFKQINDQFGHMIGDTVLRRVAQLLQETARTADIVTRFGGEEFCIVLPETELDTAQGVAERLRRVIDEHAFSGVGDGHITVSLGVATFSTSDNIVTDLLARADAALYKAKEGGRNQVCLTSTADSGESGSNSI